jgi:sulfide:quinone oxidoreductase
MDTAQHRIDVAPLPAPKEVRRRSNLVRQVVRFLVLNWTMYRMATRHH